MALLKIFALIAVLIASFCAYPIAAQSQGPTPGTGKEIEPQQKQPTTQQQKAEPDKRGTEQMPLVVKTISTPKSQTEAEGERKDHEEKASQEWWAIRLAAIVAGATFLQAIFLFFTLRATKEAANAATEAAKVAKDTLTFTQRAFVYFDGMNYEPIEGQGWRFSLFWRNSGGTKTKNLTISINYEIIAGEIPDKFPFAYTDNKDIPAVLGPNSNRVMVKAINIPFETIAPLKESQTCNLYIWGEAKYDDIFATKPHYTHFCVKILFLKIAECPNTPRHEDYKRYNEAD